MKYETEQAIIAAAELARKNNDHHAAAALYTVLGADAGGSSTELSLLLQAFGQSQIERLKAIKSRAEN
jgi:uncharacterized small protein (DUF1192 family)